MHDTAMLARILSKRLKQDRVTIVEGVKLLEVLATPTGHPDFLIYLERTDDGGSQRLKNELQAYRDRWRPRDDADEVLEWSLNDTSLPPTSTLLGTRLDINDVMSKLASTRPVFHSEADFQQRLGVVPT